MGIANVQQWKIHPVVEIFPPLPADEYESLKDDIERNGLLEPIWLVKDKQGTHNLIIDGRHRFRACQELGVEPEALPTDYDETEIPEIVTALNLRRRHLNESQRSMVAARIKPMYATAAKQRQGKRRKEERVPEQERGQARDKAAERLNVSGRSVTNAERVLNQGVPELVRAVESGKVTVAAAAQAVSLEPEVQKKITEQLAQGKAKNLPAALRQHRLDEAVAKVEQLKPVEGAYQVIVADPPWRYEHRLEDSTHRGRTPYPTMTVQEICELKVPAADDSVLWLWCTNAYLADGTAARVCKAWGFEPKTVLTWAKNKMGVGDWLRGQTEHAILATRGKPVRKGSAPSTLMHADVAKHSAKPDKFYAEIAEMYPGKKLEMFAIQPRDGWDQHGSELLTEKEAS